MRPSLLATLLLLAATPLSPAAPAGDRELARDDGTMVGKRSLAGSGHSVTFDRPAGKHWIRAVRVHGARYGGGYDPADTFFTVAITDPDGKVLKETPAPYSLFAPGTLAWVDVPLEPAVPAPARFTVNLSFAPTATKGVFVGIAGSKEAASTSGLPGTATTPLEAGRGWMIRAVVTKKEPPRAAVPAAPRRKSFSTDFEFVAKTVAARHPALARKGIDWEEVCRDWRPRFAECPDDTTHIQNLHRLLATLRDSHSGVTAAKVEVHLPAFDGLYGAGLWIAAGEGRLVLRALMPGHPLAGRIQAGADLLRIGGRPAKVVHEEVRRRVREWIGFSSDHFLDARLSFQFFPFGDADRLPVEFQNPGGEVARVTLDRWGPGGRGLGRAAVSMPEGVPAEGRAVSKMLGGGVGYVRILGAMDGETAAEFHRAFDALREAKTILLDCRGMGGGSDLPAWEMAGRFFPKAATLGDRRLEPTGPFQFAGPVVMLTDEREISSAETFTWAMAETGRAVTVGRPTGGATIIPSVIELPSGLASFRLGVHDRATPIRKVHPEGIGSAPDVFVPYAPPVFEARGDPEVEAGLAVLRDGPEPWNRVYSGTGALADVAPGLRDLAVRILRFEMGRGDAADPLPDLAGAAERIAKYAEALSGCLPQAELDGTRSAAAAFRAEVPAQRAFEALLSGPLPPPPQELAAFLAAHGASRYAAAAREAWPATK
ncbi:MAG: S41 family peptidase [Planctomycetes bacterium]|nr:S41 family peptidase [Planctomycetota bacterium]